MEYSPYLQAIQKVAGENAGKKYQTLNRLARKIIADSKDLNSIDVHPSENLPDPLIPLVKLEIARVLKKPEGIVDALKSEDQLVFERALKVKWFFNGSIENYPNVHHFQNHIWPYISLNHRTKIIKVLAISLAPKQPTIAEEFYLNLCEMYGHIQAHPLLKACRESFIWDNIVKHELQLYCKEVIYLFLKYPDLILKYLKLGISDHDPYKRNLHVVSLNTYHQFFPMLLKKYSRNLVELILAEKSIFHIELNPHHTDLFLKNEVDELIENPQLFLPMLSLKTVTRKITRSQFEVVFQKLFPQDMNEFHFQTYFSYLKFIPDNQRMTLLLDTFKKVYNKDLLECHNLISYEMLPHLPQEDRVKFARFQLETDKGWYLDQEPDRSWRCYLPIEESIPIIKNEITKRQVADERIALLNQLLYTCKVNNDDDALLKVLKYVTTRHKNEQDRILIKVLLTLSVDFKLEHLTVEHWKIIINFVRLLHTRNQLGNMFAVLPVVEAGIHFDLLNNQSITEKLILYIELNLSKDAFISIWNIIRETPSFERKCLDEFAKEIPKIYSKIPNKELQPWSKMVYDFTEAIYYFNERNIKKKYKLSNLSITNYSWLLDNVKKLVNDESDDENGYSKNLRVMLKTYERNLYNLWIPDDEKPLEFSINEVLTFLRNDPKKILDYYPVYYERFGSLAHQKNGQLFLKNSRWCQDIPAKFVEMSVNNIEGNDDHRAVLILSILLEGPAFEKFISQYVPKNSVINTEGDNSRKNFMLEFSISKSLNLVNPPVSLDFILPFCEGDYIHVIANCLINLGRRVAVHKLIPFCQELMNRNVSVKKHGIRLFRLIESISQLRNTLMSLWRKEEHISIRLLIVKIIVDVFHEEPCSETMLMISECLDNLTVNDRNVLSLIFSINNIPNKYVVEYYKKLLVVIRRIGDYEDCFGRRGVWNYMKYPIGQLPVNVAVLFPEELHEEILKTYFMDMSLPKEILAAAQNYLVNSYIKPAKNKLESRLKIFSSMFERIIKDHLTNSSDDNYIGNYFITNLTKTIVDNINYSPDEIKFVQTALDIFRSTSKPQLAPEFYCKLLFITFYNDQISPKEFAAKIVSILPFLIDIFSVGFISTIANFLYELIDIFYKKTRNDAIIDIIEFLLQLDNEHVIFLGASLLLCDDKSSSERFWSFVKILRQHQHSLVVSSVNLFIGKHHSRMSNPLH